MFYDFNCNTEEVKYMSMTKTYNARGGSSNITNNNDDDAKSHETHTSTNFF